MRGLTRPFAVALVVCIGCGGNEPDPADPLSTVRAFYERTLDGDAGAACRLLTREAQQRLTVMLPPPPCEDSIDTISDRLTSEQQESMRTGLELDRALIVTRRGDTADVDVATRDSSGAGLHLRKVEGEWRIQGLDPGAVDGGQPTDDAGAIQRLHRFAD
jgi:hypothetical protein